VVDGGQSPTNEAPLQNGGWQGRLRKTPIPTLLLGAAIVLVVLSTSLLLVSEGRCEITSHPSGARVTLDGKDVGVTPLTLSARFASLQGALEVQLQGFKPYSDNIVVEPRQQKQVAVSLEPLPAQLEIRSEPPGADLQLNDRRLGKTPLTIEDLGPGTYRIQLTSVGYDTWAQEVALAPGQNSLVEAKMIGLPGLLAVSSFPAGATVYLDDKEVGQTPLQLQNVINGSHAIRLTKPGFKDTSEKIHVDPKGGSTLDFVLVHDRQQEEVRRPIAVMIDNHPDARPQAGISVADVVYEALAEGGITRFLAFFMTNPAEMVGPVRSARHYFVHWADEYDSIFINCGSSPQGFEALSATGIANIDEAAGSPGFWRGRERAAPHNLYTSTANLRAEANRRGLREDLGSFAGLAFETDAALAQGEDALGLSLQYPYGYEVSWRYDAEANDYLRFYNGRPHVDLGTGDQVRAVNIVVLHMGNWTIAGDDKGRQDFVQTGSGEALFFMDGRVRKDAGHATHWLNQPSYGEAMAERYC
jgi:hypothetical protein